MSYIINPTVNDAAVAAAQLATDAGVLTTNKAKIKLGETLLAGADAGTLRGAFTNNAASRLPGRWDASVSPIVGSLDLRSVLIGLTETDDEFFKFLTQVDCDALLLPTTPHSWFTGGCTIDANPLLQSVDLRMLTNATTINCTNNEQLQDITFPTTEVCNYVDLSGCALSPSTVTGALDFCLASGTSSGRLDISGGTTSTLSGDLAVAGTLSPDIVSTEWQMTAPVNGRPCWTKMVDDTPWYIAKDSATTWFISDAAGESGESGYWRRVDAKPWGAYFPDGVIATGEATVSADVSGDWGKLVALQTDSWNVGFNWT